MERLFIGRLMKLLNFSTMKNQITEYELPLMITTSVTILPNTFWDGRLCVPAGVQQELLVQVPIKLKALPQLVRAWLRERWWYAFTTPPTADTQTDQAEERLCWYPRPWDVVLEFIKIVREVVANWNKNK